MRTVFLKSLQAFFPLRAQGPLPPGERKAVVERVCAPCHGVYPLATRNRTAAAWASLVDNMETRVAKGIDEDFKIVVQYLVINFGIAVSDKININKAGARSLTISSSCFLKRRTRSSTIATRT